MKCGIVDVGSNTIRLSIYQWEHQTAKLLLNKKETAGLAGYIQDGALSEAGVQTACRILSEFRALLDNLEIPNMYIFGTASLRGITNTEAALAAIRRDTGLQVDVLSGADEAALAFRGAALAGGGRPSGLLADIGGGSTELVAFRDGAVSAGCSLPLGSLSLFSQHVDGIFPTPEERKAIRSAVDRELNRSRTAVLQGVRLIGVGGTIRAAAKLYNAQAGAAPDNRLIPAREILGLYKQLKKGDRSALRTILRIAPDRVHTLLPGLVILTGVIRACGVETVQVSACGVREGYLLDRIVGNRA